MTDTDNPRAEAIEAAAKAFTAWEKYPTESRLEAEAAVDAAIPHLLAPIRALADEWEADGPHCAFWGAHTRLRMVLDRVEGARDE